MGSEAANSTTARKKKKILALRDVRKSRYSYNEFVERKSLLDQIYLDSSISKSPFKGILRVAMIVAFIYVLSNLAVLFPLTPFQMRIFVEGEGRVIYDRLASVKG